MTRAIITISTEDKKWLDVYSKRRKQSLAQTIRSAIKEFKWNRKEGDFKAVMAKSFGAIKTSAIDGVELQRKIRAEWDR